MRVVPSLEFVRIKPDDDCRALAGRYSMSESALRETLTEQARRDTDHATELNACQGARKLADEVSAEAQRQASLNAAWARWGPLAIVGAVGLGFVAGGVVVFAAERALAR